jgi:hypothetical protein
MKIYEDDAFYDFYKEAKLTIEEIRQFKEFENLSDEELHDLSDNIFDLASIALKMITEKKV